MTSGNPFAGEHPLALDFSRGFAHTARRAALCSRPLGEKTTAVHDPGEGFKVGRVLIPLGTQVCPSRTTAFDARGLTLFVSHFLSPACSK